MATPPRGPERIHPTARAFETAAGAYERARPEYSEPVAQAIRDRLGIAGGDTILDLAAGTGKLTRSLRAAFRARVIAVEPTEGMRRAFVRAIPGVPILDGTAESIPVHDGTVAAVVVGQAFHWFQLPAAAREIHRVLRTGGGLAVVQNSRDERVPWVARFGQLLKAHQRFETPAARGVSWRGGLEETHLFEPLTLEKFETIHRLDADGLADRALSVSFIAKLPEAEQRQVVEEVRELVRTDPALQGRAEVLFPYVTELYWAKRRDGPPGGTA
jgi:SAM-dependent methyltransferase